MNTEKNARKSAGLLLAVCLGLTVWTPAQAAAEEQVLIFGDSLMKLVARSLEKQIDSVSGMDSTSVVSIGSGLARMDLFDWDGKIRKAAAQSKPQTAVVMIGANDNQPMRTGSGIVRLDSPAWKSEYKRRISGVIDILLDSGVEEIYWIGLPDVREDDLQKDLKIINRIIAEQARMRPEVEFIDTTDMFSIEKGKFSPYILDKKTGMPVQIRASDGVHLNRKGADMLADIVMEKIR